MNNPMHNSNLLRSPGSGPPIAKKQRGGTTPGSIKARPRSRVGPPPTGGPPPTEVVDDAIARRRAELRRLQEKARGAMGSSASAAAASAAPSRRLKPPPSSLSKSKNDPPPQIPMSKRTSDIFPTAPKSPSMIPKPKQTSKTTTTSTTTTLSMKPANASRKQSDIFPSVPKPDSNSNEDAQIDAIALAPQLPNSKQKSANPNVPPKTPQNAAAIPPTPAVGRRLEFPSSQKATAAKAKPPPPVRSRSRSPTKAASSSFTGATSTSAADTNAAPTAGPPRAKSAPPRRPPGPPPGALPAAPPANKSTKVKAIKKSKAKRPAPVRPGTLSLLPTIKTKSPKSQASSPEKSKTDSIDSKSEPPKEPKDEKDAKKESTGPPVAVSSPPVSVDTVGKGSLDTSKLSQTPIHDSKITETPKGQKSAAFGTGGADTPPSSGSSARRQKLQLMRQQALVASTLKTAPKEASKGQPSKTSFYTASSGEPATAAFAKAIAPKEKENSAPPVIPNLAGARPNQDEKPKPSPMQSAAQARLEDAYKKSEQEKMKALIKIKELEDKLSQSAKEQLEKSKQTHQQQKLDVQTLLSVAETEGPEAALNWAKNNSGGILPSSPSKPASRTGFNTGMGATPRKLPGISRAMQPTPHRRSRMAIRALQARPQNQPPDLVDESPEATERRLIRQFKEAVRFVSFEFSSELATYIVRRPYGIQTNPQGLFDHLRPPTENPDAYQKRAHVSDKTTIEVAAIAKADNTPLLIFGVAGIRYQTNPSSRNVPPEFKHFEDVDAQDRPLGHVTYIDGQANEKEYSLDEILEEALLVREQYCGTLTSTALALPDLKQQQQQQQQQPAQKPPASEKPSKPQQPQKEPSKQQQQQMQQQQQQQQTPDSAIDSGSSDVLVVFLGMVVSFIFNLIYGIFIGTPLRIARTTIVLIVASMLLQTLHLYLADGYNEWALREFTTSAASTCSSVLASDLSWFSNQHPGIM